jgi:AraC family transcriptional regulator
MVSVTTPLLDLRLSLKRFAANERLSFHEHEEAVLCILLRGTMREETGTSETLHGPGHVIFKPAGLRHRNAFGPVGASIFTLAVGDHTSARLSVAGFPSRRPFITSVSSASAVVARLVSAMRRRSTLHCKALSLQLLVQVQQSADSSSARWGATLAALHEAILSYGSGLRVRDLGRLTCTPSGEIEAAVRQVLGLTVRDYVQRVRVEEASRLLAEGEPISAVALAVGYHDQSHLTRAFKKVMGLTPGVFRRESKATKLYGSCRRGTAT